MLPLATVTEARYRRAARDRRDAAPCPGGDATLVDAMEDGPSARAVLAAIVERARARRRPAAPSTRRRSPTLEVPEGEPANISAAARRGRDPLRRSLPAQDVPPPRGGRQPGAGDRPLPERARARPDARRRRARSSTGRPRAEPSTLAVLQAYVPNEGTAWEHAREELRRFFERVLTRHREDAAPDAAPRAAGRAGARPSRPPPCATSIGAYLDLAALLGRRTAEMHLALGVERATTPSFAPEPVLDARSALEVPVDAQPGRQDAAPAARVPRPAARRRRRRRAPPGRRPGAGARRCSSRSSASACTGLRIRTHGDYHLEQVLYTGKDFVIIDFDGPPTETLAERRRKHNCLRDVAGMIRSFHYAAFTALLEPRGRAPRGSPGRGALGGRLVPLGLGRVPARLPRRSRPARRSCPRPTTSR